MYNPESVQDNETHKIVCDFEIQTCHLIPARLYESKKKKKKEKKSRTCGIADFIVPADHRVKIKESEKRDKYQDLARELKKHATRRQVPRPC